MKTQIIQATSSPNAMPAETNNRRFSVFNDGIDATEVQERLDWKALRDMITIDTSILDFMPTGQHQIAALANLGAELVQEVKAYRPGFAWKSSPAEIVGALIEEMAPPSIEEKPQLATGEREEFDAWYGDTSKRGYVHNEVSAYSGWLAAKRAVLAAAPGQPMTVPDGWKLVPRELSEEHLREVMANINRKYKGDPLGEDFTRLVWQWAIHASPTAPAAHGDAKDMHCYDCDDGLVYADGDTEPCRACEKGYPPSVDAKASEGHGALLAAIRDGVPLEEPVSVCKAMMARRPARVVLDNGTGPLAAVHLVNIGVGGWVHTETTAKAYADGFNRGTEWLRSSIIQYADKLPPDSAATRDVIAERDRQIKAEGYDLEHDDAHQNNEIAAYATFYAMPPATRNWPAQETGYGMTWGQAIIPADWGPPKTCDRRQELVKAAALLVAEIERLDRAQKKESE